MAAPSAPPKSGGKQAAPPPRPFIIGVQSVEFTNYDRTVTLGTGTQDLPAFEIPPQGFLRGIYLLVEGTATNAATTVAYADADAPFSIIDSITVEDTNSKPILGPLGGHDVYCINKYGGYTFYSDPKASPVYKADTGTGASIALAFVLRLPIELVARDGVGALPNKSGTNMFRIRIRLAAASTVYSTPPSGAMTVRVRMVPENWWQPNATDLKGRPLAQTPPAMNTTQYWTRSAIAVNSGAQAIQIQAGLGYLLRNYIFQNRTAGGARNSTSEGNWPDPVALQFEATPLFERIKGLWRDRMVRDFGYSSTVETADGLDYSTYVLPFNRDFGLKPGAETRRGYLATADGSRMEFRGNFGAAATFVVLANYVNPVGGDDARITG